MPAAAATSSIDVPTYPRSVKSVVAASMRTARVAAVASERGDRARDTSAPYPRRGPSRATVATVPTDDDAPRLRVIGRVESALRDRADAPKQGDEGAPEAVLRFDPAVAEGLGDLAPGAEILVLTW